MRHMSPSEMFYRGVCRMLPCMPGRLQTQCCEHMQLRYPGSLFRQHPAPSTPRHGPFPDQGWFHLHSLHPHFLTTLTTLPPCAGSGYMGQVLKDAQDRNLPLQDLYLNQYIKVHAIRMLVDVDTSCQVSALHW